jgi:hypothetical protein
LCWINGTIDRGKAMEWIIWLIIIGIIGAIIAYNNAKIKHQKEIRQQYQGSLSSLKKNPGNANLRQETLRLGRAYSNLMRDKEGNTVFDEVALMNDINAACAATQHAIATSMPSGDIEARLRKLKELKSKNLIDDKDYQKRKGELMAQI